MKNVGKYVLVVLLSFFFTSSVDAAGAISVKEQLILDELTQKLEVQGNEFQVPETYITQTENYLKQNEQPLQIYRIRLYLQLVSNEEQLFNK